MKEDREINLPNPLAILDMESIKTKKSVGRMWIFHEAGQQGQSLQYWSWYATNLSTGDSGTWIWVKNVWSGLIFVELTSDRFGVVGRIYKDSWDKGAVPPPGNPFFQAPRAGYNIKGQPDDGTLEITTPSGRVIKANWFPI